MRRDAACNPNQLGRCCDPIRLSPSLRAEGMEGRMKLNFRLSWNDPIVSDNQSGGTVITHHDLRSAGERWQTSLLAIYGHLGSGCI